MISEVAVTVVAVESVLKDVPSVMTPKRRPEAAILGPGK